MFYPLLLQFLSGMVLLGFVPYMLNKIDFSCMIYKISYHFPTEEENVLRTNQ